MSPPPTPECDRANAQLLDYAYGELEAGALAEVDRHLPGCERCRGDLHALQGTRRAMQGLEPLPAPDKGLESLLAYGDQAASRAAVPPRPRWMTWAMALVPLGLAASVGMFLVGRAPLGPTALSDSQGETDGKVLREEPPAAAPRTAAAAVAPAPAPTAVAPSTPPAVLAPTPVATPPPAEPPGEPQKQDVVVAKAAHVMAKEKANLAVGESGEAEADRRAPAPDLQPTRHVAVAARAKTEAAAPGKSSQDFGFGGAQGDSLNGISGGAAAGVSTGAGLEAAAGPRGAVAREDSRAAEERRQLGDNEEQRMAGGGKGGGVIANNKKQRMSKDDSVAAADQPTTPVAQKPQETVAAPASPERVARLELAKEAPAATAAPPPPPAPKAVSAPAAAPSPAPASAPADGYAGLDALGGPGADKAKVGAGHAAAQATVEGAETAGRARRSESKVATRDAAADEKQAPGGSSPEALLATAREQHRSGRSKAAVDTLADLIQRFPTSAAIPEACDLGATWARALGDQVHADQFEAILLTQFPTSEYADRAQRRQTAGQIRAAPRKAVAHPAADYDEQKESKDVVR